MQGITQYLNACEDRKKFLQSQLAWLGDERQEHDSAVKRLQTMLDRNRDEMAGYLVPEVSDEFLAELEQRLAYPGLLPIKRDFEQQFDAAENRRAELAEMKEIKLYDYTLNDLQEKVDQEHPAYDQARSDIAFWNHSKWHRQLEKRGYYESDYQPGLLRRFWDWRAVSFLMADLRKTAGLDFQHPDELIEHYRALRDRVKRITVAYQVLSEERDRVVALKQEYDEVLAAPERLLAELYKELGVAAVEHLLACPETTRLQLAKSDRKLTTFLKKEAGLTKQIQYLKELSVATIDSRVQQVDLEIAKLDAKIRKLHGQRSRGKQKFYSDDDIQRVRNVKAEKWEKRRTKTSRMRERISDFHDYDAGSWMAGYLWWDVITRRAQTDDIYEVREHRRNNPDWDHRAFVDPLDEEPSDDDANAGVSAAAAGALAESMARESDNDLFDPS